MNQEQDIKTLKQIEFNKREERLKTAIPQKLIYEPTENKKLHITYVMTWTGVCGGSKIILEHANKLTARGHKITIISHDKKPIWFKMNDSIQFIEVPWGQTLCESIPKCDVIVATYWREIYECIEQKIAPVIYFEQGDYHLFDLEKLDNRTYEYIKKQLEVVQFVYTVSTFAKNKIKQIYNKDAIVIPNAADSTIFFCKEYRKNNKKINIAIIGSEESEFKRIGNILKAIEIVKEEGYDIELNWITPTEPKRNKIKAIVNPPQLIIGDTLRKSDIYICASMYESFCLPVLEAMTCGVAVITTNNGGNMDFVKDNENALVIEKDNIDDIVEKTKKLINNAQLRERLSRAALETSKQYSWNKTINMVEEYYRNIANYKIGG